MKILAIDPGTKCGFAANYAPVGLGTWNLTPKPPTKSRPKEPTGVRYLKLQEILETLLEYPEMVIYEEVRAHRGVTAAHVYGGIIAILTAWCEKWGIAYESVPVGTWKKAVCGNGRIKPPEYTAFARENLDPNIQTEDEAAARCILAYAEATLESIFD